MSIKKMKKTKKKSAKTKARTKTKTRQPRVVIDQGQLEALIKKGEDRGFVTTSEILYAFPKIERDVEGLEKIYDDFKERGVEITETQDFLEAKTKKEKKGKKLLVTKNYPTQK